MQNLNYYNLHNVGHQRPSDRLSELVENTLNDLVNSESVAAGRFAFQSIMSHTSF